MEKNARQFTLDEQHEIRKFISQGILQGRGSVCVRTGESGAVKVSRSVLALTDSRPRISTLLPPLRSPSVSLSILVPLRALWALSSLDAHGGYISLPFSFLFLPRASLGRFFSSSNIPTNLHISLSLISFFFFLQYT